MSEMNSESGQKCIMSEKTCIKLSDRLVFCFMFFCPPPPFSLFLSRYFSTLSFIILSILLFFLSHSLFFVSFSLSLLSLYLVFTSPFLYTSITLYLYLSFLCVGKEKYWEFSQIRFISEPEPGLWIRVQIIRIQP